MKSVITTLAIVLLTLNTPAALSAENPTTKPMAGNPATMGVIDDKQFSQMLGNFKSMQQQMDKPSQTKNPKERQKLLQDHMQSMQTNMQIMRGMGGPMMSGQSGMGMGPGGGGMGGPMMGGQGGAMGQSGMGWWPNAGHGSQTASVHDGKMHGHDANDDGTNDAA